MTSDITNVSLSLHFDISCGVALTIVAAGVLNCDITSSLITIISNT